MQNVRNFWIEADIDGRSTRVETGPQSKDGGFTLTVYQRDKGGVIRAIKVEGRNYNGENILRVFDETPAGKLRNPNTHDIEVRTVR